MYDVCVSPYAPTMHAPNWVAERLGAGRVPVYTALKRHIDQASRNLLDLPNRDVDHLVNELQMRKLYGLHEQTDQGNLPLRHDTDVDDMGDEQDATEGS